MYDVNLCISFFCVDYQMTLTLNIFYSERDYISSSSECYSALGNSMHADNVIFQLYSISSKYTHS